MAGNDMILNNPQLTGQWTSQIPQNYGVGNYTGDDREAEYTYRDLQKAQYADYKNRFEPYLQQTINDATKTDLLDQQLSRITALSGNSKSLSMQAADMARSRYGMNQTAQQQQSFNTTVNLGSALTMANASNNARQAAYDNYQSVMTGSTSRPGELTGSTGGASS